MTSNTKNQETKKNTDSIRSGAGITRGVRLWPDPDGILVSPFTEQGQQMGYVYVYGEQSPAVYDGVEWHSILVDEFVWNSMEKVIADQYYKIIDYAKENPAYMDLTTYITGGMGTS